MCDDIFVKWDPSERGFVALLEFRVLGFIIVKKPAFLALYKGVDSGELAMVELVKKSAGVELIELD